MFTVSPCLPMSFPTNFSGQVTTSVIYGYTYIDNVISYKYFNKNCLIMLKTTDYLLIYDINALGFGFKNVTALTKL